LCELAEEMMEALCAVNPDISLVKVDISNSAELFARYGVRIPVLRDDRGRELNWPFAADELAQFVRA